MSSLIKYAIKVGFVHLLSANIILQIAAFGGQLFLTRILPVEDIGRIKVLQSFFGIIIIIASLGLNTAVLKLCSERISETEKKKLFINGFLLSIFASLIILIITIFASYKGLFSSDNLINKYMIIFVFQTPFLVLSNIIFFYYQAQKKLKEMSKLQSFTKIVTILISTFFAFYLGTRGYIFGLVLMNFLSFLLLMKILFNNTEKLSWKINFVYVNKLFKIGIPSFFANLLGQLLLTLNVILSNYFISDKKEIGYFGIAHLIFTTLLIIPSSLNQLMVPYISENTNDIRKVQELLKKFEKRMMILVTPIFILAYFLVPIFLPIFFGSNYINSVPYLRILLFGLLFWSIYSPKGITLASIGRVDLNLRISFVCFILNIFLTFVLLKTYGMIGAAFSTSITYFFGIFINKYYYFKAIKD
jgi:O-antigen/teichoic acid export membrane protein